MTVAELIAKLQELVASGVLPPSATVTRWNEGADWYTDVECVDSLDSSKRGGKVVVID